MFRSTVAVLAVLIASVMPQAASAAEPLPKVIGAYYPGGSADRYPVQNIPAGTLTHLFYAFATIDQGQCVVAPEADAHFKALATLKRAHPTLHTLISIGGWNAGGFSDAALTAESRQRFVSSCVAMFFERHRGSFDGVDIDWEFPVYGGPTEITDRPEDRQNMTLLVREFRRQLDALDKADGQHRLVTAALPAGRVQTDGPYDPARSYELKELARTLDFINLMSYDMGTGFSAVSTFNAPLHAVPEDPLAPELKRWNSVAGAVAYYEQHGVPKDKLLPATTQACWVFRSTAAASSWKATPTRVCISATARRIRPATGARSRPTCSASPAGSDSGTRSRRLRGCTTPPRRSSSATRIPPRSACAPTSPRTAVCAAFSCGS